MHNFTKPRKLPPQPKVQVPEKPASYYLGHPTDEKFEKSYQDSRGVKGYTLPFSKYIGPGNALNAGEPINNQDKLAKIHDLQYSWAKHQLDSGQISLQEFDLKIKEADGALSKNSNIFHPHGAHSISGITSKQVAEKIAGRIYPSSKPNNESPKSNLKSTGKYVKDKLERYSERINRLLRRN